MDIQFHGSSHHQPDHQSTANPKDPYVFWDRVEHGARVTVRSLLFCSRCCEAMKESLMTLVIKPTTAKQQILSCVVWQHVPGMELQLKFVETIVKP